MPRKAGSEFNQSVARDSVYRLPAQRQHQDSDSKHDAEAGKTQDRTDEHLQQAVLFLPPFCLRELTTQSELIEQGSAG
jgi:hypothetical protein